MSTNEGDRELLELAAKAAGLTWHDDTDGYGELPDLYLTPPDEQHRMQRWNPLTDDGDALRLAVKLRLFIEVLSGRVVAKTHFITESGTQFAFAEERGEDEFACTRRAIVRAAAEIERMKR